MMLNDPVESILPHLFLSCVILPDD